MSATTAPLLTTPLNALHIELGARMVPFAGYSMPVQYPAGLVAEHHHTRNAAGLFDVSHMGQLRLVGADAAAAFESLIPVDVIGLPAGKQRYGLLLTDEGTIIDDLMFVNRGADIFVIVNGACKVGDIAHIQARIGQRCAVIPMPERALLALQGPQAVTALARLVPGVEKLVFMTGGDFRLERRGPFHHAQRLHRRRRVRDLGAQRSSRGTGTRPACPARGQADWSGRTQLVAPRSRPVPLRQRH